MIITAHARQRVFERTAMRIEDVRTLIRGGATICLGSAQEYAYYLFYAPFDRCCKIAVTTTDQSHLISIWEHNFFLPPSIRRPTREVRAEAIKAYRTFVFSRLTIIERIPTQQVHEPHFDARIEVRHDGFTIYTHQCGTLTSAEGKEKGSCLQRLKSHLKLLASNVEENKEMFEGRISYRLILRAQFGAGEDRTIEISHNKLVYKVLKAAPK